LLIPDLTDLHQVYPPAKLGGPELGLIGQSFAIQEVRDAIDRLKQVDSMVLLLGESGTGKEVVARAIHKSSDRANQRFDAINCGAIPEALLESELFGHKRGAFTDAKADRKGIFELCTNGTLLLDEIGDMPLMLQMKLLRVLQEWEVTPVGSSVPVKIKTRVISATHHDLKSEAHAKQFREDLYYRLSIVMIHLPPLRERLEDVPVLSAHFLDGLKKRFNREVRPLSPSVLNRMLKHHWPGNVRELQNALERAVVMSRNGELDSKDIFAHLCPVVKESVPEPERNAFDSSLYHWPLTEAKLEFERNYLKFHLTTSRGQIPEVADKSGRYKADVYRLLSRHGIDQTCFRN
jgi:DNA-binding NtrC family response regulator